MFFAGNIPPCLKNTDKPTSTDMEQIIQTAKHNIENYYAVVGLTSHIKSTFKLFEAYLPKFFSGASRLLKTTYEDEGENANEMVNHFYDRNISEKVLDILMEDPYMEIDNEIFLFVQRRFHLQLSYISELKKKKNKG